MTILNRRHAIIDDRGGLPTAQINDFFLDAARGQINGVSPLFKFGRAVVTSTPAVIWDGAGVGGFYDYRFVSAAETLQIVSTSTNDTAAGTGARTILVYGLDSSYNEQFELITMNGLTPVNTVNQYLRHHRAFVLTSGSNTVTTDSNEGTISVTGVTTGYLYSQILPRNGQTLMTVYTVPAGKIFTITGMSVSVGQGKEVLVKAMIRNGPDTSYAFTNKYTIELYQSTFTTNLATPLIVPEKTDLCFTAVTSLGSTLDVSASYGGLLIDT